MRGSTFLLGSSSCDRWNAGKISLFVSLSFFIRFFFLSLLFASPPFLYFFFFFPFSPSYPSNILFVYSPSHFLFILHFLFSLIFSSLSFSLLFSFIFSFLSLFYYHQPNGPKFGGNFPPLSSIATCPLHVFFLIFFIFFSCFILHLTFGSM